MNETSKATVFTLLHNYEEYGDEIFIHNGRIALIVAGKKRGAVLTANQRQRQNRNITIQLHTV